MEGKISSYFPWIGLGIALGAFCLLLFFIATPRNITVASSQDSLKVLSVTGTGNLDVAPDQAKLALGVMAERQTAKGAQEALAENLSKVISALEQEGVEAKDIRTSNLNLEPVYYYGSNQPPKLTGYRASSNIVVTTSKLDSTGDLLDLAVQSGANTVQGVTFTLKDQEAAKKEAIDKALEDARNKADQVASKTGVKIKETKSVTVLDHSPGSPYPVDYNYSRARGFEKLAADTATVPIMPGEMTFTVWVEVQYLLE
jgi:uncharacterized protein YggE